MLHPNKEDVVHKYNGILLGHKKKEIMPFAETWMQPEIIILSEVRKKDKFHTISLTCGIQNIAQMNISKKQK